jgi:ATPase subunit of ABC transporter with duplicated ATPase domains
VIEREQEWISSSPKARQAKSKARFKAYDELIKANDARLKSTTAQIIIPPGERLGDNVISVEGLNKAYGDRLLIEDLSFKLPPWRHCRHHWPQWRGQDDVVSHAHWPEKPDAGKIEIGDSVQLGYVDQSRDSLDPDKTVWQEISGGNEVLYLGKREMTPEPIPVPSISRVLTSSRRSEHFRADSATGCIWRRC